MKKIRFKVPIIAFVLVILMIFGSASGCITITTPQTPGTSTSATTPTVNPTPINPDWTAPPITATESRDLPSIADVVALVKPSVVAINTEVTIPSIFGPATEQGAGSGWILDEDGIIVTNNHVVEGAKTITVTLDDGRTFTVDTKSISTDSLNDLAIIKIDATNLPALKRGNSSSLRVGDWVIAIGNALGQGIRATEGIVSRKGVSLSVDQGETLYDLIETSAAINPGNSGGPLVNLAGQVIGITSAKIADIGVEGMGYAISIDTAIPIIQELVNRGYVARPWLGVELYTINQLAVRQLKLPVNKGVLLTNVTAGGPAAKAGLAAGDVIVNVGGKDVTSVDELTQVLYASKIGQPLDIVYWRGNNRYSTQVIPGESPPPS